MIKCFMVTYIDESLTNKTFPNQTLPSQTNYKSVYDYILVNTIFSQAIKRERAWLPCRAVDVHAMW